MLLILGGVGLIGLLVPYLFLKLRKPSWKIVAARRPRAAHHRAGGGGVGHAVAATKWVYRRDRGAGRPGRGRRARYHRYKSTGLATQRAAQLVTALKANGYPIQNDKRAQDFFVATFGDDGGYLLAYPTASYLRGAHGGSARQRRRGLAAGPLRQAPLPCRGAGPAHLPGPTGSPGSSTTLNGLKLADTLGN